MSNKVYTEYIEVMNALIQGHVSTLEMMSQLVEGFPKGHDQFIHRHWITNAIDCGSYESVVWVLSKGVDLLFRNDEGYTVLHSCIDREKPDKCKIMNLLIDKGADIDKKGINDWTPLHMAAMRSDIELVKLLLLRGARTDIKTEIDDYATAEVECRRFGNLEIANYIAKNSKK